MRKKPLISCLVIKQPAAADKTVEKDSEAEKDGKTE